MSTLLMLNHLILKTLTCAPPMSRYRVFIWGIFFLAIACGCLCYFWCCAVPPGYSERVSYSVSGTNVMMTSMPVHGIETQPLFPGMQYSSSMQYTGSSTQYGGAMMPPAYQFAQLYPSHVGSSAYVTSG
jgi:uncharacterized membrane protein YjgN (DUF898 family)